MFLKTAKDIWDYIIRTYSKANDCTEDATLLNKFIAKDHKKQSPWFEQKINRSVMLELQNIEGLAPVTKQELPQKE
ncbi:hypothetical protein CR513_43390, partial [Mucuna pruriens]